MAKEAGPAQPRPGGADQTAEQRMKGAGSLTPWGIMHHATKHVAAALTFTNKLSQATDLHDRMRIHAEHAQMHMDLFQERAKELTDAMAVAGNFMGAIVSQLRLHANLGEMARKSSAKAADGEGQTPGSKSKP